MIAFKIRTSFKQYMLMKTVKMGFKVSVLVWSEIGYLLNFLCVDRRETEEKGFLGEKLCWN